MPPATITNSGQALQQLQQAQQGAQDPNAILTAQNKQYGVDAGQQTVQGLRGAIDNTTRVLNQVAPSVMGRTAQSLVTSAQANRQIANEQAPISQTLNAETSKYNEANTDLSAKEQQARDAANGIYEGQQNKLSYLQNLYNTLYGKEKDTAAAQSAAAAEAERQREFNASLAQKSSSSASTNNPAAGYSVKQLSSGNKAYTSPNGQTNLYQYAAAIASGDPNGTFKEILSQLASGSPTDKGAYNIVKSMPMDKAISYLKQHNGYIFN